MLAQYASTPRLYFAGTLQKDTTLTLPPEAAHYLCIVLRLQAYDVFRIFNGKEGEFLAEILVSDRKKCVVEVKKEIRHQMADNPLTLIFAPLRKERQHFLIEKAIELGVTRLIPIITARTNAKAFNEERARKHIIEATEQCERLSCAVLHAPTSLHAFLEGWPKEDSNFFCKERSGAEPLAQSLLNHPVEHTAFLIGPEGGFTTEESILIESYSFIHPISLGLHILRSETAALSALGFWQLYQKAHFE